MKRTIAMMRQVFRDFDAINGSGAAMREGAQILALGAALYLSAAAFLIMFGE